MTENPPLLSNDLTNNDLNHVCMYATTNSNSWDDFQHQEIYQALSEVVPKNCYVSGMPLAEGQTNEIFSMLLNQFPNQLSTEIIHLAAQMYFDRVCYFDFNAINGVGMKIDIQNPVGYFRFCYMDAIKQYKNKVAHEACSPATKQKKDRARLHNVRGSRSQKEATPYKRPAIPIIQQKESAGSPLSPEELERARELARQLDARRQHSFIHA